MGDVSPRPAAAMAYIEYPVHAPDAPVVSRDLEGQVARPSSSEEKVAQERLRLQRMSGWASDTSRAYQPLGVLEEIAPTGEEARRRANLEYIDIKPRVVEPNEARSRIRNKKKDPRTEAEATKLLVGGKPLEGEVRRFDYTYYEFELKDFISVTICLVATQGDPDIFVSNDTPEPNLDTHTWKSNSQGEAAAHPSPPLFKPSTTLHLLPLLLCTQATTKCSSQLNTRGSRLVITTSPSTQW